MIAEYRSPNPMVSIVEAARERALALNLKRLGLFGTRFTMRGTLYREVFLQRGVEVVVPEPEDQAYIHEKYMGELVKGITLSDTGDGLLAIADRLRDQRHVEGILLGGTELPLILRDRPVSGIPFLDTTTFHVRRIVAEMLS